MSNPITPPELGARLTAAQAVLVQFERDRNSERLGKIAWEGWAVRLSTELASVVGYIGHQARRPPAATYAAADGGAWISPGDLYVVRQALHDAQDFTDTAMRYRYASALLALGDDR